jgi:hypothetical protein
MTPAQRAQVDECRRALAHGAIPADLRELGFAEAAISAAIMEERNENDLGRKYNQAHGRRARTDGE